MTQARALLTRLVDAWRELGRDQRLAALSAIGLFVSMLLPWYSKTDTVVVRNAAHATEQSLSAFQAFSFVEAAVLLVSAGVLALLFSRAEQRDFHLPGGDGTIVTIAGAWAAILIFYRLLDKPGLQGNEKVTSTVGVQWGIFIALLVALGLAYVGKRIRADERAEPPVQRARPVGDERGQPTAATRAVPTRRPRGDAPPAGTADPGEASTQQRRPRFPPPPGSGSGSGSGAGSGQMSFEDTPPGEE